MYHKNGKFDLPCVNKKAYLTHKNAIEAANKRKGVILRVYHCPHCNMYHLTSKI